MFDPAKLEQLKAGMAAPQPGAQSMAPMQGAQPQAGVAVGQPQKQLSFQEANAEIRRMMQQNPQMVEQIKSEIGVLMEAGEITPQELNMMVQLARAALQDPKLYPQIRAFAIQQGLGTEQDLPQEYDQGLVITIIIAGEALGGAEAAGQGKVMPSMKEGGALPARSSNPDGSMPIEAHEGEYVVPADVVRYYGTKHFDALKEKMEKALNPDVESGTSNN